MSDINTITVSGEVINNPTLSQLKDGPILSFAVESITGDDRLIVRVDARNELAEATDINIDTGDHVEVTGKLAFAHWVNKSGHEHKTYLVKAQVITVIHPE